VAQRARAWPAEAGIAVDIVARTAMRKRVRPWSEPPALATADLVVDVPHRPRSAAMPCSWQPSAALAKRVCVVTLITGAILLERASELGHSTLDGRGCSCTRAPDPSRSDGLAAPIEIMTRALTKAS
jgi:hypothetical protein